MAANLAGKFFQAPQGVDVRASAAGLRAVAILEAGKGLFVVLLVTVIITLHGHIEDYTEDFLYHLHVDFDHRLGQILLDAASKLTGARILTLVLAASAYVTVRFVEAWGLWHRRVWAEWFALLSGAIYLPWELVKVAERVSWLHVGLLAVNVAIIAYMLEIRIRALNSRTKPVGQGTGFA